MEEEPEQKPVSAPSNELEYEGFKGNFPLEDQLSTESVKPTKLNKNGKPRKQMTPEALERLAKAREKANAIRKQQQVKKLEEKVEKLNTETQNILPPKEELKEEPKEKELKEEQEEVEIIKEKPKSKPKGKKKTKIIVEQSSDDSDEFEPNDNVVFVKRVSRKKKEPVKEPQLEMEQPPPEPPKPPMKPQLTPQQMMLRDNYNAMFSGGFINQNGMRRHY